MHEPYEQKLNHKADFRVNYKFYNKDEGGRTGLPYQGYRCDFWYEADTHIPSQVFMIWPEFEDEDGNIITNTTIPIKREGEARMWIIMAGMRSYHQKNIKIGMHCFLMESHIKVAECTIIEILDLCINPIN